MGVILRFDCPCGYTEELYAGGGLNSINPDSIGRFFEYEAGLIKHELGSGNDVIFSMENLPAVCDSCKRISAAPSLRYSIEGAAPKMVRKNICAHCGCHISRIYDSWDDLDCPVCGKKMTGTRTGLWD